MERINAIASVADELESENYHDSPRIQDRFVLSPLPFVVKSQLHNTLPGSLVHTLGSGALDFV